MRINVFGLLADQTWTAKNASKAGRVRRWLVMVELEGIRRDGYASGWKKRASDTVSAYFWILIFQLFIFIMRSSFCKRISWSARSGNEICCKCAHHSLARSLAAHLKAQSVKIAVHKPWNRKNCMCTLHCTVYMLYHFFCPQKMKEKIHVVKCKLSLSTQSHMDMCFVACKFI